MTKWLAALNDIRMIDKQLNYGRNEILDLARTINTPVLKILDIGAGKGDDLLNLKQVFPNAEFVGAETYPDNVKILGDHKIQVISVNMEKDRIPFPNDTFDIVLTNQFMEHTKEIFWIMHEVSRVLKVDGHLIVGVPNLASLHNRLLLMLGKQPTCIQNASAHVRGYTKSDFNKFLSKSFPGGFELKAFRGSNFYPFPPAIAKPLARLFPNFAWGITMLFQKKAKYQKEFLNFPIQERLETNFFLGE